MVFVDEVEIDVLAGGGGNGAVTFRREKFIPRGGPDGGDGGRGGSVIIQVDPGLSTLADLRYQHKYKADRGGNGAHKDMHGKNAEDLIISVPPGTVVYDRNTGAVLADLVQAGHSMIAAQGGVGGRGNASFASSTHQTPKFGEMGEPGESRSLRLELKLLADVGIIGYPNVGKSTLISKISAAKPKIADYPFTTLIPNLGVVRVEMGRSFVVADIPGLIEGAHEGAGLGRQFLRHIERTNVLVHILDVSGLTDRDPLNDYHKVNQELSLFSDKLAALPQMIVLNKIDVPGAEAVADAVEAELASDEIRMFKISALTGQGVQPLIYAMADAVEEQKRLAPAVAPDQSVVTYTVSPEESPLVAKKTGDHEYTVSGREVERIVAMTDLNNEYALRRLHRRLERAGVNKKLKALGAEEHDTVRIGPAEFEFIEEDVER
jgi:GTPase